jgi:16S rRNA (guanine966-N2)-methyltransferase
MKILRGKFRGRNFYMPKDIRPTQNVVRKAIFDMLGDSVCDMEILDLFSGSGAMGLEAISNGVKKVTMVEKDSKCFECIAENIELFDIPLDEDGNFPYEVICGDVFAIIKQLAAKKRTFDLIFCDPPYGRGLAKKALNVLSNYDILQPTSLLIFEHLKKDILPEKEGNFVLFKTRRYGMSMLSMYKKEDA